MYTVSLSSISSQGLILRRTQEVEAKIRNSFHDFFINYWGERPLNKFKEIRKWTKEISGPLKDLEEKISSLLNQIPKGADALRNPLLHLLEEGKETEAILFVQLLMVNKQNYLSISCEHIERAYEKGCSQFIKFMIKNDLFIYNKFSHGQTQLHLACRYLGMQEIIYLLGPKFNEMGKDAQGNAPLHYACQLGDFEAIVALLTKSQACKVIDELNERGETPLYLACSNPSVDIRSIQYLVDNYKPNPFLPPEKNSSLPFQIACLNGRLDIMKILYPLMEAFCQGTDRRNLDESVSKALLSSCEQRKPLIVQWLLETCKADPNQGSLNAALRRSENDAVLELLLTHPDIQWEKVEYSSEKGPFHICLLGVRLNYNLKLACQNANDAHLRFILSKIELDVADLAVICFFKRMNLVDLKSEKISWISIDSPVAIQGLTLLHMACKTQEVELVKCLIEKGAEIDCKNEEGETPLHIAASNGNIELVHLLYPQLKRQRNLKRLGFEQKKTTPLCLAAKNDHSQVIEYFIDFSENLKEKLDLKTALDIALDAKSYCALLSLFIKGAYLHDLSDPSNAWYFFRDFCEEKIGILYQKDSDKIERVLSGLFKNTSVKWKKEFFSYEEEGTNIFHIASSTGNYFLLSSLISEAKSCISLKTFLALIHKQDSNGITPLYFAILKESAPCILLLMKNNIMSHSFIFLIITAFHNSSFPVDQFISLFPVHPFISLIIAAFRDRSFLCNSYYQTLSLSYRSNRIDRVKSIVDSLTDSHHAFRSRGWDFFYLACEYGDERSALTLLRRLSDFYLDKFPYLNQEITVPYYSYYQNRMGEVEKKIHFFIEKRLSKPFLDEFSCLNNKQIMMALHLACQNRMEEVGKEILFIQENLNLLDHLGRTPLHYACQAKSQVLAEALIEKGAIVDLADKKGVTPLHEALNAKMERVALLLSEKGAYDTQDNLGYTPIVFAVENGLSKVAYQLAKKINSRDLANRKTRSGQVLFELACEKEMWKLAIFLTTKGADFRCLPPILQGEFFYRAIKSNYPIVMGEVEKKNFTKMRKVRTPLHQAISKGKAKLSLDLIQAEKSLCKEADHRKRLPIHIACEKGLKEVVETLIKENKEQLFVVDCFGATPLHYACRGRYQEVIKLLREYGASLLANDKRGQSPFELIQCLQIFDQENKAVNFKWIGETSLQQVLWCLKSGHVQTLQALIVAHCQDPILCQLLEIEIRKSVEEFCKLLNPNNDFNGDIAFFIRTWPQDALEIAKDHPEMIDFLRKLNIGANQKLKYHSCPLKEIGEDPGIYISFAYPAWFQYEIAAGKEIDLSELVAKAKVNFSPPESNHLKLAFCKSKYEISMGIRNKNGKVERTLFIRETQDGEADIIEWSASCEYIKIKWAEKK